MSCNFIKEIIKNYFVIFNELHFYKSKGKEKIIKNKKISTRSNVREIVKDNAKKEKKRQLLNNKNI